MKWWLPFVLVAPLAASVAHAQTDLTPDQVIAKAIEQIARKESAYVVLARGHTQYPNHAGIREVYENFLASEYGELYFEKLAELRGLREGELEYDLLYGRMNLRYPSEKTLAAFDRVLAKEPAHPEATLGRARCYSQKVYSKFETDLFKTALEAWDQAVAAQPEAAETHYLRAKMVTHYAYRQKSREYFKARGLDADAEAKKSLDAALKLDPDHVDALRARASGRGFGATQDYAGAVADLDRAIELDPKNDLAYGNRAGFHALLLDFAAALADQDRVIELKGTAHQYSTRADYRRRMGDLSGALQDIDKAIATEKKEYARRYHVTRAVLLSGLGRPREALSAIDEAIVEDPQDSFSWARELRARLRARVGDRDGALADCTFMLEKRPGTGSLFAAARVHLLFGETEEGTALLARSLKACPETFHKDYIAHLRLWNAVWGKRSAAKPLTKRKDALGRAARFVSGRLKEKALTRKKPKTKTPREALAAEIVIQGYLGLVKDRKGKADAAREHFRAVLAAAAQDGSFADPHACLELDLIDWARARCAKP